MEAQIATKGDEIRKLKENGIEKPELAPHIEELLALKAKLANLTGEVPPTPMPKKEEEKKQPQQKQKKQ